MRTTDPRNDDSRRDFIRKLAYTTPTLMTLPVVMASAQVGSAAPDCESSIFIDCDQPETDEFGCRIGSEFPTFGPDGNFLNCSS